MKVFKSKKYFREKLCKGRHFWTCEEKAQTDPVAIRKLQSFFEFVPTLISIVDYIVMFFIPEISYSHH